MCVGCLRDGKITDDVREKRGRTRLRECIAYIYRARAPAAGGFIAATYCTRVYSIYNGPARMIMVILHRRGGYLRAAGISLSRRGCGLMQSAAAAESFSEGLRGALIQRKREREGWGRVGDNGEGGKD